MSRQLLILRHAKSDWKSGAQTDFDRPLAKRGRKAAKSVGSWLRRRGLIPDHIFSSPALRARQTAVRLCRAAKISEEAVSWSPEIYLADVETLLHLLAACAPEHRRVMVIGHNPDLELLLRHLAGPDLETPPDGKLLPTAALAVLEMPEEWSSLRPGSATLSFITRPRDLSP